MGDVISISRVGDVDIFSQFDQQCPDIPPQIDTHIPENARNTTGNSAAVEGEHKFRNHCILVVVLSLFVLAAVEIASNTLARQLGLNAATAPIAADTDYRSNQAQWLAHIKALELDPAYQRILEEKRLYALQYSQ